MRMTTAQLESMRRIDIANIDKDTLVDVSGMTFDNTLPKEQRAANMLAVMKNPYCFRHGDMVIKLEFADDGPPLPRPVGPLLPPYEIGAVMRHGSVFQLRDRLSRGRGLSKASLLSHGNRGII